MPQNLKEKLSKNFKCISIDGNNNFTISSNKEILFDESGMRKYGYSVHKKKIKGINIYYFTKRSCFIKIPVPVTIVYEVNCLVNTYINFHLNHLVNTHID